MWNDGWINQLSAWAIPSFILLVLLAGCGRRIKLYEAFVEGAAEGFGTSVRIIPFLVAMMVATGIFRSSGAMDCCAAYMAPLLTSVGLPPDLLPLAIMRPLSGSGSLGLATEMMSTHGPDSLLGRIAATMLGSTDTTFYILTVYFGAVGVTRPRYSVFVGLCGDMAGIAGSILIWRWLGG